MNKGEKKPAQGEPKVETISCREGVLCRDRMRRQVVAKEVDSITPVDWHGFLVRVNGRPYFIPMATITEVIYES